ncbi:MAG TPA: L,D-transpeptidase [Mycobacteriales bacterium]|nr:L,D-transpeptidase [Mycobacteriales bacterium]
MNPAQLLTSLLTALLVAVGGHAPRSTHAASPCGGHRGGQLVIVSIERQHLWACDGSRAVISTAVTTGATRRGDATPRGTFAVEGLDRNTTLTTSGGASFHVRYWIPFHVGVWGFHDASWQKIPFGSRRYVNRGSHGCVHLPLAAIRRLFHWVKYGTRVQIR